MTRHEDKSRLNTFSLDSKGENPPPKIGNYLKQKRLAKDISFEQIAEVTNIRPIMLKALEEDDLETLPADVYVRGFIKIYAEFLKLDTKECLAVYQQQAQDRTSGSGEFDARMVSKLKSSCDSSANSIAPWQLIGLVLILCLAGYITLSRFNAPPQQEAVLPNNTETPVSSAPDLLPPSLPASETAEVANPEPLPTATLLTSEPTAVANNESEATTVAPDQNNPLPAETAAVAQDSAYILSVNFVEKTWLWVQLDDKRAQEFSFDAGERLVWKADKTINLYLGNAGGVELQLNGTPLPKLGKSGQTKKISIPQDFPGTPPNGL